MICQFIEKLIAANRTLNGTTNLAASGEFVEGTAVPISGSFICKY